MTTETPKKMMTAAERAQEQRLDDMREMVVGALTVVDDALPSLNPCSAYEARERLRAVAFEIVLKQLFADLEPAS